MNFTNTDCVGKNWSRYNVWGQVTWQGYEQVGEQVEWKVYVQIKPIKTKIEQELNI